MRVERFSGRQTGSRPVRRSEASAPPQEDLPREEPVEDDFEPAEEGEGENDDTAFRVDPALFPFILEGLEPLSRAHPRSPATYDRETETSQILQCAEVKHRFRKVRDRLCSFPADHLLQAVLTSEDLLKLFVAPEVLSSRGGVTHLVDTLVSSSSLPFTTLEYQQMALDLECDGELYGALSQYSETYFAHRYGLGLVNRAQDLFKQTVPELTSSLPLRLVVKPSEVNNAEYEWVEGEHRLTLLVAETLGGLRTEWGTLTSSGSFREPYRYRRENCDLISVVHEYGHALYDRLQGRPANSDLGKVSRALSEGFAILCELLVLDTLSGNCSLPSGDRDDFRQRRKARVEWLQSLVTEQESFSHLAYAEGTELICSLFRKKGAKGVLLFIQGINGAKSDSLSRRNPRYRCSPTDHVQVGSLLQKGYTQV